MSPADLSRRSFLRQTGLVTAGFLGLRAFVQQPLAAALVDGAAAGGIGYGPLLTDPAGHLELPKGFSYSIFSRAGEVMDDGFLVPGRHDGMAAFPAPGGRVFLIRNHELESEWLQDSPFGPDNALLARLSPDQIYDAGRGVRPNLGGTTTLVYDPASGRCERQFLSLAGTVRNCAGGPTPWGTWVTCEEVNDEPEPFAEKPHGFNFEVSPSLEPRLNRPVPLKAMGRFRHEAIAVDPDSGAVYQTEDIGDGVFYRFLPNERENLAAGGRLQVLVLPEWSGADTRNWPTSRATFPTGRRFKAQWVDIDEVESPNGDLRHRAAALGAAVFARAEGAWYGNRSVYFACTNGGRRQVGQVFRYHPSPVEGSPAEQDLPGELELFVESEYSEILSNCDNLTVAPNGDLILCEDTRGTCRLIGITARGEPYVLARHTVPGRELAGACFSPDGGTLFVNIQSPGQTLAIRGPWRV